MNIRRKVFACAEDSEGNESYYSVNDTYAYNDERIYSVPMTEEEYALFSEYCADRYFATRALNGKDYMPDEISAIKEATGKSALQIANELQRGIDPTDPDSKKKLDGVKSILKAPKKATYKDGVVRDNSSINSGHGKGSLEATLKDMKKVYDTKKKQKGISAEELKQYEIEGQGASSLKKGTARYNQDALPKRTQLQRLQREGELDYAFKGYNGPSLATRAKILGRDVLNHVKDHKLAYGLGAGALGLGAAGILAKRAYDKRKKEQEEKENGED